MSRTTIKLLAALATVPLIAGLAACAAPAAGEAGDDVVKIGVVGKSDPQWAAFEEAAAAEDITIELVDFADYAQPNPATTEGELDLNQYQHIVYLADYNVSAGEDLAPIGSTAIYPLGLYSQKYDSVGEIPEGETVAVPNDASNQARALLVLQSAGLVELKSGGTIFSDLADIDEAKSKVKVTALEASLTPTSLPDVAAAGYVLVTLVRLTRAMCCSFRHAGTGGGASGAHRPLASRSRCRIDRGRQPLADFVSPSTLASEDSRSFTGVTTGTAVPPDASTRAACTSGSVWKISTSFR